MGKLIQISILQLFILQAFGQKIPSFHPPLNIPLYLSGNFGEIRADHFHSGIDIKTRGTTGHHVYSIDKGYVSRIKVQANGYGKSIYVAHPEGYTSVYGHLSNYREDIAFFVRQIQYERQSHAVNIYLEPEKFKLDKGELLAYSGNTGGSSGPHLHLEVRTTADQHPTNVLQYGFEIADNIPPRFNTLFVCPAGTAAQINGSGDIYSTNVVPENGYYTVPYGTSIKGSGPLGIGVEVFDYLDGVPNRCGIFSIKLFVDEELIYHYEMDEFAFSETRYINAHILYRELIRSGKKVHRLHKLPNDRLRIYRTIKNNGIVDINEKRNYNIRIVAADVAGNVTEFKFRITGTQEPGTSTDLSNDNRTIMRYNMPNRYENNEITLEIPEGALYEDLKFSYDESPPVKGSLSKFYHLHSTEVPVHLPYTLSVRADSIDESRAEKLLLITPDGSGTGNILPAGGEYRNGFLVASLRSFGNFAIGIDTIAPEVTPLNGSGMADLSGRKTISFNVKDNLSGIEKYEGYIDNRWALFEYDPKNELITYTFDSMRISKGGLHELELYITDAKENVNLYHTTFTW